MSDLLPERLSLDAIDEDSTKSRSKRKPVLSILDWVQCFSLYTSIISHKQPGRVPDLLGYQSLIIDAQREFQGDHWLGYDRRFRLRAAATHPDKWANVDITLWMLAFAGRGARNRCKFCFSTSHDASNCELTNDPQPSNPPPRSSRPPAPQDHVTRRRLCFKWNESPSPRCSRSNCVYDHICYICYRDPLIINKHHKALHCCRWKPGVPQRPTW